MSTVSVSACRSNVTVPKVCNSVPMPSGFAVGVERTNRVPDTTLKLSLEGLTGGTGTENWLKAVIKFLRAVGLLTSCCHWASKNCNGFLKSFSQAVGEIK